VIKLKILERYSQCERKGHDWSTMTPREFLPELAWCSRYGCRAARVLMPTNMCFTKNRRCPEHMLADHYRITQDGRDYEIVEVKGCKGPA
jgi:hypothetical protein